MLSAPSILLPVKHLAEAKLRLADILDASERAELALAMLGDVLDAIQGGDLPASVLSPDPAVLGYARSRGVRPLRDASPAGGLNEALQIALERHYDRAESVLIVLADTPLVTTAELRALLVPSHDPGLDPGPPRVVIAPDRAERGTNALLLQPATAIPTRFGPNSMAKHLAAARTLSVPCTVSRQPGLSLDLDTPADLEPFLEQPSAGRTDRFLARIRAAERLAAVPH